MSQNNSNQTEIGAIWKKDGATQKFLSISLDFGKEMTDEQWNEFVQTRKLSAVAFTNKFKQNGQHPDLRIFLSRPKDGAAPAKPAAAPSARTRPAPRTAPAAAPEPSQAPAAPDDEII